MLGSWAHAAVQLEVPSVGELLGQGDAELIAQGIDQHVSDTAATFLAVSAPPDDKYIRVG